MCIRKEYEWAVNVFDIVRKGKGDFSEENAWLQPVVCVKKVLDEENSLFSGGSFCTKGGRLLAQERSSITSGKASQPHTPEEKQQKITMLERGHLG